MKVKGIGKKIFKGGRKKRHKRATKLEIERRCRCALSPNIWLEVRKTECAFFDARVSGTVCTAMTCVHERAFYFAGLRTLFWAT